MIISIINRALAIKFVHPALYVFIILIFTSSTIANQNDIGKSLEEARNYLNTGEQLRKLFPDSAIFYFQNGLTVINNLQPIGEQDSSGIIKVILLAKIGQIFHMQSKYSFATEYYQKALAIAGGIKNDSLLAECNFNLGEIYLENGSYDNTVNYYNRAIADFEKIELIDGIFWSYIGLGIVYREMGNTTLSKEHYEKALAIGKTNKDEFYIGTCYNNIGNLFRQTGDYETAVKHLQFALESFEKLGNKKFISDCLEGMGNVYSEYGDNQRAIEYYKRSTKLAEDLNDFYRLLGRYANIAKAYSSINEDEQAVMYFSKTLELAQSIGDKSRLSEIYVMLSDFYKKKNDYDRAVSTLKKALSISKEIGDTVSIALASVSMAGVYYSLGDMNNAMDFAINALLIAEEKNLLKIVQEASFYLANVYEYQNNYSEALNYFQKYSTAKDSLLNSDKIRILEETEAKFNLERVEKEKLRIENEALIAENKVQERNILIGVLSVALVIFLFLFGRFFRRKRAEKKASEQRSLQLNKKIDLLSSQLDAKNRELSSKAIMISRHNKILEEISVSVDVCLEDDGDEKSELRKLKNRLNSTYQEENWDDFLTHFNQVHPGFYEKLVENYPDLTPGEQKICAFLRMNLNTKEIAQINGHSVKSIEVARTRIRKKLGVNKAESLTKTIQQI